MKIRNGFVSNSSSSSFVIAYDPTFFGNFLAFLEEFNPGYESIIYNSDHLNEDFPELKERVKKAKQNGKQIAYFRLNHEYTFIVDLMKMINESNGGEKLEIIYGDEE